MTNRLHAVENGRFLASVLGCMLACTTLPATAQPENAPKGTDTVTVVPAERYHAAWMHEIFFGAHWRDAWTTPVAVPVLDLSSFAGGLTPIARGGGLQTRSLRFQGGDGKVYKFRSLDKDPAKVLPAELHESIAADIVQDQISSSNPFAPLVAVPLMNAVGILNAEPFLVVLPDDERLGEYRAEFAGLLGTLEEHPDDPGDGGRGFAGADKVVSTFSLLAKMEEDHRHQVDQVEYLKARLVDIYLGDWDRHTDQWRWAGFQQKERWVWRPIPRDRDQAFARFDGVFPWTAELAVPQLTHFNDSYPQINDLTWSGRHLDRRLLNQLPPATWDSVTSLFQTRLTDELIASAVRRMPPPLLAKEGMNLEAALCARRDNLPWAATEFYHLLTKYQDIHGSDRDEHALVRRLDSGRVSVQLFARNTDTGEPSPSPFYSRLFTLEDTKELRLLLHGGNDQVVVTGTVDCSPEVHVDGGEGRDELRDESSVAGWFLGIIPFIPVHRTKTYFYDSGKKTTWEIGKGTKVIQEERPKPATEAEHWEPPVRDYGHDWKFGPWFGYTPDDGLFIGGGPILYEFGFRTEPYVYRMSLRAGYATALKRFRIDYTGAFHSVIKGARLSITARASAIDVINYFGPGNETVTDQPAAYYKIRQQQVTIDPAIDFLVGQASTLSIGIGFRHARTELDSATLLGATRPYGTDDISLVALMGRFTHDTRDNPLYPSSGTTLLARFALAPRTWNNEHTFGKLGLDARLYVPVGIPHGTTIAFRLAGETLFGTYPFFEAAALGGSPSLRAFERQRFTGDALLLTNIEIRIPVAKLFVLVPTTVGLSGFGETGRVFQKGEESRRWHPAGGAGVWASFVSRDATLSVSIARSAERTGVYITAGFMF